MRKLLWSLLLLIAGALTVQAADEVKDVTLDVSGMNTP